MAWLWLMRWGLLVIWKLMQQHTSLLEFIHKFIRKQEGFIRNRRKHSCHHLFGKFMHKSALNQYKSDMKLVQNLRDQKFQLHLILLNLKIMTQLAGNPKCKKKEFYFLGLYGKCSSSHDPWKGEMRWKPLVVNLSGISPCHYDAIVRTIHKN